jgi:SAM-dependent methyltransferase
MHLVSRSLRFVRGALLSFGPEVMKRTVWNREYAGNKWHFADSTVGDCVYPYLEKYAAGGSILDLGCGSGNTANELADAAYHSYMGVDISDEALAKARKWTADNGREHKNRFTRADLLRFEPTGRFDVILFRESLYHVPLTRIIPVLNKYAAHLNANGVFIVRLYAPDVGRGRTRPAKMLEVIADHCEVVDKGRFGERSATVIVFRKKHFPETATTKRLASAVRQ